MIGTGLEKQWEFGLQETMVMMCEKRKRLEFGKVLERMNQREEDWEKKR